MSALNGFAMLLGYAVLIPVTLFAALFGICWLFEWISYHAVEAHYRVKRRRFQAKDPS